MQATLEKKQLRCPSKLHGIIKTYANGRKFLEVHCKNKLCVDRHSGIVILHYFDLETGELDHTNRFRDPNFVKNAGQAGNLKGEVTQ